MTGRRYRSRLAVFVACWTVYGVHFATNVVREHYPAFSLAERATMRVDPYVGLHDDIFEIAGRGAFINSNPGASMLGAVPYALLRPLVDVVVARVAAARAARGAALTSDYEHPREDYREFFRKVRERGLDVRFGIAAAIMQLLLMAPLSAGSVLVMHRVLEKLAFPERSRLLLALLYGFGTPVFFRTGFLNQNLLVADFGFFSFALLAGGREDRPGAGRLAAAGVLAGMTLLCDYSGVVILPLLAAYALYRCTETARPGSTASVHGRVRRTVARIAPMVAGAAVPIGILLAYQQWAFGNPLLPAQHYMPRAEYGGEGWNGFTGPDAELLYQNLFDLRFGLLPAAPLLALAFIAPVVGHKRLRYLPLPELALAFLVFLATWIFSSSTQFARLQWETGVRYLLPAVPFLFLPAAAVLVVAPRALALSVATLAVAQSWCLAMVRSDPLTSIGSVVREGVQLPWLTTLQRMRPQYGGVAANMAAHPAVFLALLAAVLAVCCYALAGREPRGNAGAQRGDSALS